MMNQFSNLDLEHQVLGTIIKKSDLLINSKLESKHFSNSTNKLIYETVIDLINQGLTVDVFTINQFKKQLSLKFLIQLENSIPTTENFIHHVNSLIEFWKKRSTFELLQTKLKAIEQGEEFETEVNDLTNELHSIQKESNKTEVSRIERFGNILKDIEERDGTLKGASWGYSELDKLTKGIRDKKLIIIAARPAMGKSAFVLNVADHISQNDVVALFSLEMPENEVMDRLISCKTHITSDILDNAKNVLNANQWGLLSTTLNNIYKSGLYIYEDPNINVLKVRQKVMELQKEHPGKRVVVIIDYLQLINPVKPRGNRQEEVSEISRQLKLLATDLDIPVIALSQLSRAVEQRQDKRPMMSDLRESGGIEQDADAIAFLYREEYYDPNTENKNIVEVIISKIRNGKIGTVNLAFIKEYSKFVNLERRF